jgi:F-type H+-transporting ATPase subunit gamma
VKRQLFLQHRLQTLSALQDAVGAMRSLAAHHFRRARQALPAARQYRHEMDQIIQEIGIWQTLDTRLPSGLLVVASDLGLCSDYNARLAHLAVKEVQQRSAPVVYSVGRRARANLAKQQVLPARTYDAPASLPGLSHLLLGLAQDILEDYLARRIGSLLVISAGFEGVGHFALLSTRVLPIQPARGALPLPPSPYLNSSQIKLAAIREYLYITLYEILLDAIASEHGMRLMAAESALEWLDSTASNTARRLVIARSEASTQELLDIVAGGRKSRLYEE